MKKALLLSSFILLLTSCSDSNRAPPDLNMVISVSSDAHYAIATNTNKQAILWDLQNRSYKVVFKDANIYSAYFIKNTDDFMYQNDKTNEVVIENVEGQIVKTFNPGFPTYGEVVTSDLKTYFASDRWFQLYKTDLTTNQTKQFFYYYCGPNYTDETPPPAGMPYACQEFLGSDQLFGLNLTTDERSLISTASGSVFIWDAQTAKLLQTFSKNEAPSIAAINPGGAYLVTGDIADRAIKVNFSSTHQLSYQGFFYNFPLNAAQQNLYGEGASEIFAIRFIDQDKLLVFRHTLPYQFNYAALYDLSNIKPIVGHKNWAFRYWVDPEKYLPLIDNPDNNLHTGIDSTPLVSDDFSRDQAIDTSPSAHILVMSQQNANGIIVYKYDPGSQTLTRVWTGTVKPWWRFW